MNSIQSTGGRVGRWWAVVVAVSMAAAAFTVAVPAAAAVSGTIVFTKDHNVWIMAADDPSTARPVTEDGTAQSPYLYPSQDDVGRIVAVTGGEGGQVVRLNQQGDVLNGPFDVPGGNFWDLDVRADGEIFTYTTYESYSTPLGFYVAPTLSFAYTDGRDSSAIANPEFDRGWGTYSRDQVFLTSFEEDSEGNTHPTIATYGPGDATLENWFRVCELSQGMGADAVGCYPDYVDVTTAQDRLVTSVPAEYFSDDGSRLWVFDMPGPAPATPTWGCELVGPAPTDINDEPSFANPEWSPDGSALVYEFLPYTDTAGAVGQIYIASGFDQGCEEAFASAEVVVTDAASPDWSPAPLGATPTDPDPDPDPGPDPVPTVPPSDPTQPSGAFDGNPATTERINAGDPIAAGLLVSRARFADGGAARVVLSRDDTFPDSLAGAGLSADGPLLFTLTDRLLPQVREEIERVLPPGGTVHLLGGTAALSQAVHDELVAAGYVVDRLAGASRVETSLAVADRVRELAPDQQAVALARSEGVEGNPTAGWADSVTGGAYGAALGMPILVTPTAALHPAVAAWLDADQPSQTVLFGGTAALSQAVEAAVPDPLRIAGTDRTATAAAIATQLWGTPASGPRRFAVIDGFHDDGWAFGLAVAGMAADAGAPLLMVNGDLVPDPTAALVTGCQEVDLALVGSGTVVRHTAAVDLDALDDTC